MRAAAIKALTAVVIGAAVGVVPVAGSALAEAAPVCHDSTATLTDRPDSGVAGNDWALDAMTRKTHICETAPGVYAATVTDTGTFTTQAGKSPAGAVDIQAGIHGSLAGGFTAAFTAPAGFDGYQGNYDGKTYSGSAPSSSGDWVKNVWGGEGFVSVANLVDWKWTYWTCGATVDKATEKWVNAETGNSGDITGKACPSPSPSPSPTGSVPPAPVPTPVNGNLPVTG